MALKLEVITPDNIALQEEVHSIVLPTPGGEIGVFKGHVPLATLLQPGELRIERKPGSVAEAFAVDKGFIRIFGDVVTVITEAAVDVQEIDLLAVEKAEARAKAAIEKAKAENKDPSEYEQFENVTRFAIAQRLAAGRKRR